MKEARKREIDTHSIRRVFAYRVVALALCSGRHVQTGCRENRHCLHTSASASELKRSVIIFHLLPLTSLLLLLLPLPLCSCCFCSCITIRLIFWECTELFRVYLVSLFEVFVRFGELVSSFYSLFVRSHIVTVWLSLALVFFVSFSITHSSRFIHVVCVCAWCSCISPICVFVSVCVCVSMCLLRGSSILRKILIHSDVEH